MATRQPAAYAVDQWFRGANYTARIKVYRKDSATPEDLTGFPVLSIGVEGEGVDGPQTGFASVRFDPDAGGGAGGALRVLILRDALELGRLSDERLSTITYTILANDGSIEDRVLAHVHLNVLESALI